jgi:hypothetical protein
MDKQSALRICENRVIKRQSLERPGFFVRNPTNFEAFYFLKNFLQQVKCISKTTYYLPIYERFAMPVSPYQETYYNKAEIIDLIDRTKVCREARSLSTMETAAQQRKNSFNNMMAISVMGIVIAFIIVVLLASAGKFNLSSIMGG